LLPGRINVSHTVTACNALVAPLVSMLTDGEEAASNSRADAISGLIDRNFVSTSRLHVARVFLQHIKDVVEAVKALDGMNDIDDTVADKCISVLQWMWDETSQTAKGTTRAFQLNPLPLTAEYLKAFKKGENRSGIAMSIMGQSGHWYVVDASTGETLLNERLVVKLTSLKGLTGEHLQTALEQTMPFHSASTCPLLQKARLACIVLLADGAGANTRLMGYQVMVRAKKITVCVTGCKCHMLHLISGDQCRPLNDVDEAAGLGSQAPIAEAEGADAAAAPAPAGAEALANEGEDAAAAPAPAGAEGADAAAAPAPAGLKGGGKGRGRGKGAKGKGKAAKGKAAKGKAAKGKAAKGAKGAAKNGKGKASPKIAKRNARILTSLVRGANLLSVAKTWDSFVQNVPILLANRSFLNR